MAVPAFLFSKIRGLTRPQKRQIFTGVDTATAAIVFVMVFGFAGTASIPALLLAAAALSPIASAVYRLSHIKLNAYGRHALFTTAKYAGAVTFGSGIFLDFGGATVSASQLMECWVLLTAGCMANRYLMLMALLHVLHYGQNRCRVLIYGAGETGQQMAMALRNHHRILPVAFLDDDLDLQAMTIAGLPVLSPACAEHARQRFAANRILLAMPSASASKLAQITRKLNAVGLEVQALPSFAQLAGTEAVSHDDSIDSSAKLLGRNTITQDIPNLEVAYGGRVVMVSGAGGSVGAELCRQLIASRPKTLILFERSELALYTIDRELRLLALGQNVEIVPVLGSVTDARLARNTMVDAQVEVVFHAAAYKHLTLVETNPVAGLANNVIGTRIFAEAAVATGVARFVLISTDKAVRPISIMGGTKYLAEQVIQDLATRAGSTRFSTVRFGNVLGSSGSVVPLFRDQIARGGPVTLTDEDVARFFMTLAEAARLVLFTGALWQPDKTSSVFVLDMGDAVKIRDLAEKMIRAEGLSVKSDTNPTGDIEIVVTGLRQGEKLNEQLFMGENLLATPHPKIMRSQELGLSEFAIASALNAAKTAIDMGDQDAARAVICKWVAGFPQPAVGCNGVVGKTAQLQQDAPLFPKSIHHW